jgi:hypothetical protein
MFQREYIFFLAPHTLHPSQTTQYPHQPPHQHPNRPHSIHSRHPSLSHTIHSTNHPPPTPHHTPPTSTPSTPRPPTSPHSKLVYDFQFSLRHKIRSTVLEPNQMGKLKKSVQTNILPKVKRRLLPQIYIIHNQITESAALFS